MTTAAEKSRENGKKGGRPRGVRGQASLDREIALKAYRDRVTSHVQSLLDAQMTLARGQTYLYKIEKEVFRNKKGDVIKINRKKPELVTSQYEIEQYLENKIEAGDIEDPEATYYFLTTKDPDGSAVNSMMDRTFGRPSQDMDITTGGEKLNLMNDEQLKRIASRLLTRVSPSKTRSD